MSVGFKLSLIIHACVISHLFVWPFALAYLPPHNFITDVFGPFNENICFLTSLKSRVIRLISRDRRILDLNTHHYCVLSRTEAIVIQKYNMDITCTHASWITDPSGAQMCTLSILYGEMALPEWRWTSCPLPSFRQPGQVVLQTLGPEQSSADGPCSQCLHTAHPATEENLNIQSIFFVPAEISTW